jgi:ABC-type phosphate/phosphonate transport system ATPase subunit
MDMNKVAFEKLKDAMQVCSDAYYRLVLLVGPSGSGKTTLLREIALQFDVSVVNTGLELSRSLLELTEENPRHASQTIR